MHINDRSNKVFDIFCTKTAVQLYLEITYTVSGTGITVKQCESIHIGRCTLWQNRLGWRRTAASSQATATNTWMHWPNMTPTCVKLQTITIKCIEYLCRELQVNNGTSQRKGLLRTKLLNLTRLKQVLGHSHWKLGQDLATKRLYSRQLSQPTQ